MNKTRKSEILYNRAKGRFITVTASEETELKKYKVDFGEGDFYSTKANINGYITAVDKGYRKSFYDWCMDNGKADRRQRGTSKKELKQGDNQASFGVSIFGGVLWGCVINLLSDAGGAASVFLGVILTIILYKSSRKMAAFTVILLPLILLAVLGTYL